MSKFSNLSFREKVLIYILIVVALISGSVYLLILPTSEQNSVLEASLAEAQYEEQEMRLMLESRPAIEKGISSTTKRIAGYENKLYPLMTNDEIDKLVTTMFIKNNLKPLDLTLVDTAAQEIPAFMAAEDATKPVLISNTMKAKLVSANLGNLATMASSIGKNPSMRVLDFTATKNDTALYYNIDLSFIIYMVDKTNNQTDAAFAKDTKKAVEENAEKTAQ